MSRPSIICVAIVVLLSTAPVDGVKAKGTFRLQGPWPSSTAHYKATDHQSGSEQFAHVLRAKHQHQHQHQH